MSQARIEQLESLLSRVQRNRRIPARSLELASPAPATTSAAPMTSPASAPSAGRSLSSAPAARGSVSPPARSVAPPGPPPSQQADKRTPFRSPLAEPAAKPASTHQTLSGASIAPPTPEQRPSRRPPPERGAAPPEPRAAAPSVSPPAAAATVPGTVVAEGRYAAPFAEPDTTSSLDHGIAPLVIEPEPMREPARPIAQVVSRHAPQVDATFGAMLKRSLSLRPH